MNIQIAETITHADNSTTAIVMQLSDDSVSVHIHEDSVVIYWDDIHDVELLADMFGDISVRMFKHVIKLLAKAHTIKDL